ncbi:hypothetical protein GCM10023320_15340 [Pseudonocardia adelaidensis]|uniref:Uncharacterized protein n=1 Tax=Pseudonocardia adelaidensis TaxID=648754 RepID=A0ABP9NDZ4_9PSEU
MRAAAKLTSGGSSDSEANDWQVKPMGPPGVAAVTTTMPDTKWPSTSRMTAGETGPAGAPMAVSLGQVPPAGGPPHISTAQLPAGRAGEPAEYVQYEAGPPTQPTETWIRRYTCRPPGGGHYSIV